MKQRYGCGLCGVEKKSQREAMGCCGRLQEHVYNVARESEDRAISISKTYTDSEVRGVSSRVKAEMICGVVLLAGAMLLGFISIRGDAASLEVLGRVAVLSGAIATAAYGVWFWMR